MTADCCWEDERYWFRYRTGAIIVRDGKMLFVKSIYGDYIYMIGGGVNLCEDSKTCIEREVFEETGVQCTARRSAIICENFFKGVGGVFDGKDCHVLEFYYIMDIPEGAVFKTKNDNGEDLVWVPVDELKDRDIRPAILRDNLKSVIDGGPLLHLINVDKKET